MRLVTTCAVVMAAAGLATGFRQQADPQALPRMVATERAFAAATAEIGVRDGFLSFFADDAVQIRPGPPVSLVPAREALAAQALPKLPIANQLIWEPFTGHVSSDGTLGWLTGGYVSLNRAQQEVVASGAYFSVWKRQANGTWRVWLDEGIRLPQSWKDAAPFRVAPDPDTGMAGEPGEPIDAAEAAVRGGGSAWRDRLASAVRLHIDGLMPLAGRDDVVSSPRGSAPRAYTVLRTEAAASGDLAVTVGGFDAGAGPDGRRGTWVRVWKRDVTGRWRIVFQTEATAPSSLGRLR
jgi:ketosteroid isomerase-like protein